MKQKYNSETKLTNCSSISSTSVVVVLAVVFFFFVSLQVAGIDLVVCE
jgi:hypothetical protein